MYSAPVWRPGAWEPRVAQPDVFGAMAVLSGDSYMELTHKFVLYKFLDSIWPEAPELVDEGNHWARDAYNLAAATRRIPTGPRTTSTLPVAFPSGELIEEVGDRWLSRPQRQLQRSPEQFRSCRGSCSTSGSTTTTTSTGVIDCSAAGCATWGSRTRPGRTPVTTVVAFERALSGRRAGLLLEVLDRD